MLQIKSDISKNEKSIASLSVSTISNTNHITTLDEQVKTVDQAALNRDLVNKLRGKFYTKVINLKGLEKWRGTTIADDLSPDQLKDKRDLQAILVLAKFQNVEAKLPGLAIVIEGRRYTGWGYYYIFNALHDHNKVQKTVS